RPDIAFFGQKDAQQARLIQHMARDLNLPVRLQICPTVRESDGLALSSRNQYLDPEQRRNASMLYKALQEAEQMILKGERSTAAIEKHVAARDRKSTRLNSSHLVISYAVFCLKKKKI